MKPAAVAAGDVGRHGEEELRRGQRVVERIMRLVMRQVVSGPQVEQPQVPRLYGVIAAFEHASTRGTLKVLIRP